VGPKRKKSLGASTAELANKKAAEASAKAVKQSAESTQKWNKRLKTAAIVTGGVITALNFLKPTIDENSSTMAKAFAGFVDGANSAITWLGSLGFAAQALGINLTKESFQSMARQAKSGVSDLMSGGEGLSKKVSGKVGGLMDKLPKGLTSKLDKLGEMGMKGATQARGVAANVGGKALQGAGSMLPGASGGGRQLQPELPQLQVLGQRLRARVAEWPLLPELPLQPWSALRPRLL